RGQRAKLAAAMAERLPQALALRRSGRMKTELRQLDERSRAIARAATYRSWLTETIRGVPDIASAIAGAICLWICFTKGLPVEDAVAALTALALVVWPLRRLADVRDRQQAFAVAASKLEATLSGPTLSTAKKRPRKPSPIALEVKNARLVPDGAPVSLTVSRGQAIRLEGPAGVGKSRLLTMAAGLEKVPSGRVTVLGQAPGSAPTGQVLYLGRFSPQLKGTLRRECTLGIARTPSDTEILSALEQAGLMELHDRLGGLSGQVAEGRRNLTSSERARLYLVRGLLSNPDLALIDADEIGLTGAKLCLLLDHFARSGAAVVLVTSDPSAAAQIQGSVELLPPLKVGS
ncbi:MAG: ATP-binding cassette domain-containing protein, partial [Pseudomonadota bacterium]